jgi:hypothetical protein
MAVIGWAFVAVFLLVGAVLFCLSLGQPAEKQELALQARHLGIAALIAGFAGGFVLFWFTASSD